MKIKKYTNAMEILLTESEVERAFTNESNYIGFLRDLESVTGIPIAYWYDDIHHETTIQLLNHNYPILGGKTNGRNEKQ
jgi:hypothetical protein